MHPAVFFDRDDTLIHCRSVAPDGDLGDPALVRLVDGAGEACEGLRDAGFALVVVSNQGGVARGKYPVEAVEAVNARVNELLGGVIERFYYCPYHPEGTVPAYTREHPWRKPSPGMLTQAAMDLGLDLERSWMVGDAERDVEAGSRAGCRTILVSPLAAAPSSGGTRDAPSSGGTRAAPSSGGVSVRPDAVVASLGEAAAHILLSGSQLR